MIYSGEIVVPANTSKAIPISDQVDVVQGVVRKVWVRWRWGSANLCGCKVFRGGFQLWPSSLGEWFPSNVQDVAFDAEYEVTAEPFHFIIRAYNLDDTYDHTLWVGFSLLRGSMVGNLLGMLRVLGGRQDNWQT